MPTEYTRQIGDEIVSFLVLSPQNEEIETLNNIAGELLQRIDTLLPTPSRKSEHVFVEARKALCRDPVFRREILRLRKIYLRSEQTDILFQDVQTQERFDFDVGQICNYWKIPDAKELVAWLARNWDPNTREQPPDCPSNFSQGIWPWRVNLEYWGESKEHTATLRRAVIELNPGISLREARKATDLAVKALRPARNHGGRPGLTEIERQALRQLFKKLPIPTATSRQQNIRRVVKDMKKAGKSFGESTVAAEYRHWLKDQGHSVKQYAARN